MKSARRTIWRIMAGIWVMCAPLLAVGLLAAAPARAQDTEAGQPSAAEVKAALLFNFARYIEWPKSFLPDQAEAISLGVLGDTEETRVLEQMVAGKTIAGRRIVFKTFRDPSEVTPTHILFFTIQDSAAVSRIINQLPGSVLTVGDLQGFLKMGGIINFTRVNDKIRFEINLKAAERAGIKISLALIRLADSVIK